MGQSRATGELSADASWATHGVTITVSGAVAVGLGLVLTAEFPVLASVLAGVPTGLAGWMVARRVLARTVGWTIVGSPAEGTDDDRCDPGPGGAPVGVGSDR